MIVPRVFKSRQRKRKNISIVLSSHQEAIDIADENPDFIGVFAILYGKMQR